MPITPDPPFPKKQGDNIRSKDWNDAVTEIIRLDNAKANLAGANFTGPLSVSGALGVGLATPPTGKLQIDTNFGFPALVLKQAAPTWSSTSLFADFRYIRTEFAGNAADGPFRQFNVGAGGVSIGFSNVPAYGSQDALYVNGNVGIGIASGGSLPARLNISGVGSWNSGLQMIGSSASGVGMIIDNTVAGGHRYALISGSSGNGAGMNGGFGLYDDTANLYRLVVDSNGQLGVGVHNPEFRMDVNGRIRLRKGSDGSAGLWLSQNPDTTNRAFIGLVDDNNVGFWGTAGAQWAFHMNTGNGHLRMLATGNPINVTSTWQGSPDNVTNVAEICNDTNHHRVLMIVGNRATNGPRRVGIWDQLFVGGNLIAGSDLHRKEDITPLSDSLPSVLALRGVRFRWRTPGGDAPPTFGLIAQEVEEVFPELVETGPDGMKALNYQGLIGPLVEAIKQQHAEISELRAEVQSLKAGREN